MRTLIISDVHANLSALNAVLEAAAPFSRVWCLGDVVGYGPDPNECIDRIQSLPLLKCIKGNHDAAIVGDIDIKTFNYEARTSLQWLESQLNLTNRRWLEKLDERLEFDDITMAHGSPRNPIWEYMLDVGVARENMSEFSTHICLVGHTHVPSIYQMQGENKRTTRLRIMPLDEAFKLEHKTIVNPGSVGQPRDHDPRASFMIYDDQEDSWVYHRVKYDVEKVQQRIFSVGLPRRHATRLAEGW